jgi:hypothetical protein
MLVPVGGDTTVNTAPELGAIGNQSITAENTLSFAIFATDNDGTIPILAAAGLPPNAVFVDNNEGPGTFTWPTTSSATGTRDITFKATDANDSMLTNSETVTVLVLAANNTEPTINGSPATSVNANSFYSFTPSASDPDGDTLSFSISSKPSWASFNTGTGRLSGTPKNGDAGSYSNITITVSDGTASASIGPFSIQVDAAPSLTGNLSVSWTAPVARTDGEPLSLADISGYHIYFGGSSGNYTDFAEVNDGAATSWTVTDVPVGTSYVVMTTFDSEGRESVNSQEVSKPVQ